MTVKKVIKWFKRHPCKNCDYYTENNICQSKKLATCGNHPYVNWFDRLICEPYKIESNKESKK